MSTFNQVLGTFNLTRDPELRYTPKGAAVAELGLASNHKSTNAEGVTYEEVWFGSAVSFGKQAETLAKWFRKGQPITLQGRLKTEQWEDKATGQKKTATRLVVDRFHFVPGYNYKEGGAPARATAPAPAPGEAPAGGPPDDDVPY